MMKFTCLPTWLLTKLLLPCHPVYGYRYSLSEWHSGRTAVCKDFDRAFWISGATLLIVGIIIEASK